MQWFRFYGDALNDPKVQSLDGDTFKVWVNLLCVTSQCNGHIIFDDISFHLRMSDNEALAYCVKLANKGLLIPTEQGYKPNGWEKFQYKSNTSAERTRAYRERKAKARCDVTKTSHVTPPDTDTETDKRSIKKGTRFALNELPEDWKEFCIKERPDLNPNTVFLGFADYWIASPKGVKLDWFATWRNWVRNQKALFPTNQKPQRAGVRTL